METVKCDSDHPQISKEPQETFKVRVMAKTTIKTTTTTQLHNFNLTFMSLSKLKARITTATISSKFCLAGLIFQNPQKIKNKGKRGDKARMKVFLQELEKSLSTTGRWKKEVGTSDHCILFRVSRCQSLTGNAAFLVLVQLSSKTYSLVFTVLKETKYF